jgi:hypothetical protein
MSSRVLSLRECARIYDRLRGKYFLCAEAPLHIPPPASALVFSWLPDNSDALALTGFDEDGDPFEMRFHPKMFYFGIAYGAILHELTHIRLGYGPSCGAFSHAWRGGRVARSMAWYRETVRLANAGAIRL